MKCFTIATAAVAVMLTGVFIAPAGAQVSATGGNAVGLANSGPQAQAAAGAQATGGNAGAQASSNPVQVQTATQRTEQEQLQFQGQDQDQRQIQGNIGLGSGNKTSIEIDAPVIPAKVKVADTPDVALGGIFTANACALGFNIGGSGPGIGVGGGLSWESQDCRKQQVAAQFYAKGATGHADGDAVLCSVPSAAVAPTCKKLAEAQKKADAAEAAKLAAQSRSGGPDLSDPYIRARVGK